MLKLYNTLTRQIEEVPKKDHLNLYTCGPTVYNFAHIGNLRSFIMADLLYRTLKYEGYNPKWVMNVTDIEDKIIKATLDEHGPNASVEDLKKFTDKYFQAFLQDLREVNVSVEEIMFYKVTEVVPQIQEFILELIKKGYAYKAEDGSTYFSIEKYQADFGDYGQLVGEKFLQGKKIGARVKVDEYEKENLSDFALWKAHDELDANIYWDHPMLGKGRPGWHIECSVINHLAFEGQPTDIHTGGVDLVFPHHTNEIAQSQALLGKGNFVKHWFHSEHLLVDGKKMSKSAKNFYTLKDIHSKTDSSIGPLALKYLFLQSHYKTQQNFVLKSLKAAYTTLEKLFRLVSSGKPGQVGCAGYEEAFPDAINNDLNVPEAVSVVWKLIDDAEMPEQAKINSLLKFDKVLGLNLKHPATKDTAYPEKISTLLQKREQARQEKKFEESDELRKQIEALGYEVMDTE